MKSIGINPFLLISPIPPIVTVDNDSFFRAVISFLMRLKIHHLLIMIIIFVKFVDTVLMKFVLLYLFGSSFHGKYVKSATVHATFNYYLWTRSRWKLSNLFKILHYSFKQTKNFPSITFFSITFYHVPLDYWLFRMVATILATHTIGMWNTYPNPTQSQIPFLYYYKIYYTNWMGF